MDLKEALLAKGRMKEETLTVADVGEITVRALTREEALPVTGKELDVLEAEVYVLSKAMVEPTMSEEDIRLWQKVSPAGEIQNVFEVVNRLSGMTREAPKAAYKSTGE